MTGKQSRRRIEQAENRAPAEPKVVDLAPSTLELFIFRELPGELRYLLSVSAELPDVVAFAAGGARDVLNEISGDSPAALLQRSAVQLRSHAEQIHRAASDLLVLAGRLQGLAWSAWASEQATAGDSPSSDRDSQEK